MTRDGREIEIAITGLGAVTSLAAGAAETFAALCAGESGLKPLQHFDAQRFRARAAYEIAAGEGPEPAFRASALLVRAAAEALEAAGLAGAEPGSVPCFVGTGLGELRSVETWWLGGARPPSERLAFGPALHEALPAIGHVDVLTNACAASLFALASAVDAVRLGETERALVLGVDIISESMFGLLDRVQMTPPDRVRPFDRDRLGVLMGDGASAVVIEPLAAARARGAAVRGVVRGVGLSCDAKHETAPDPDGMERAIRAALAEAGASPDAIGFAMAHGTGTALNDKAEFAAIRGALGARTASLPITAIKSMTGHTSGASGLMGLIAALLALSERRLPPTLGFETFMNADEEVDLVRAPRAYSGAPRALVNAFGFGGVNASVVVEEAA